jgi:hypothetical protein
MVFSLQVMLTRREPKVWEQWLPHTNLRLASVRKFLYITAVPTLLATAVCTFGDGKVTFL